MSSKLPNREVIKLWHNAKLAEGMDPKTWRSYEIAVTKLAEFIDKPLVDATSEDFEAYFTNLYYKKRKQSTINKNNTILRIFYNFLVTKKMIGENPIQVKAKPLVWKPKYLDKDEMWAVISAAKTPLEKAVLNFLFSTGVRADECINIKKEHILWNKGMVAIPDEIAKAGKGRNTMISESAMEALKAYIKTKRDGSPYLFSHRGKKYEYQSLLRLVKKVAGRAGITKGIGVHSTRHTFATMFINSGGAITDLAQMLGHRHKDGRVNVEMTTRYIEVLTGNIEKAAKSHFMDEVKE